MLAVAAPAWASRPLAPARRTSSPPAPGPVRLVHLIAEETSRELLVHAPHAVLAAPCLGSRSLAPAL